jgi:streptomycin 6-kinase
VILTNGLRNTWAGSEQGRNWLAAHESMRDAAAARWDLRIGDLFEGSNVSFVWAAWRADGTPVVLKINFPEPEGEFEAEALRQWDGRGAARLVEEDKATRTLLIERCEPGDQLWNVSEAEAMPIAAGVLRQLHVPALPDSPILPLAEVARRWAVDIPRRWESLGRPFEAEMIEHFGGIERLLDSGVEPVVLHQDLHGGNILRSGSHWVAIDPKPLVGDPAFDTASLLRDRHEELFADPDPVGRLQGRIDLLAAELDLDPDRMLEWAIIHALAWGVDEDRTYESNVACARLLTELAHRRGAAS